MQELIQIIQKIVVDMFIMSSVTLYQRVFMIAGNAVMVLVIIKFVSHWFSNILSSVSGFSARAVAKSSKKGDKE